MWPATRLLIALLLMGAVGAPVAVMAQSSSFGFTPNASTQSMSVTNTSSSITLGTTTGATVLVQNVGAATAYVTNTGTATTAGVPIVSGASMFLNFAPGSTMSAITASSTATLLVTKGIGNSAIAIAGAGGAGGGAVTIADGADVAEGAVADAAATAGSTGTISAKLRTVTAQLNTISSAVQGAIPAGTAAIGTVGQTGMAYETVAASQTAQAMGATGATGDYLSHCIATPGTTSPGVVTILDNSTAIVSFAGGASSVSNLVPFAIPIGALSVSGAWKITTGANITVVCVGRFT